MLLSLVLVEVWPIPGGPVTVLALEAQHLMVGIRHQSHLFARLLEQLALERADIDSKLVLKIPNDLDSFHFFSDC